MLLHKHLPPSAASPKVGLGCMRTTNVVTNSINPPIVERQRSAALQPLTDTCKTFISHRGLHQAPCHCYYYRMTCTIQVSYMHVYIHVHVPVHAHRHLLISLSVQAKSLACLQAATQEHKPQEHSVKCGDTQLALIGHTATTR